jgi:DNA replication protein DnaC
MSVAAAPLAQEIMVPAESALAVSALAVIEGPAGVGKSWLACALGQKACRDNRSVLYQRVPRMFGDLALARGDGRHPRLMRALGGTSQIPVDRWHDLIGEPTLAAAILDRIIHNAHRLQLRGDSLRKQIALKIAAA